LAALSRSRRTAAGEAGAGFCSDMVALLERHWPPSPTPTPLVANRTALAAAVDGGRPQRAGL
jgi:hypothetical protein